MPVIGVCGFTTTGATTLQPVPSVYDMTTVPAETPDTLPVADPTVAVCVLLDVHTPPNVASLNCSVIPVHTIPLDGVIGSGCEMTCTVAVVIQPVGKV